MGAANCLITNIFQNILFCVKQKKETHTVLEQLEGEEIITIFIFGWTIPLRATFRLKCYMNMVPGAQVLSAVNF